MKHRLQSKKKQHKKAQVKKWLNSNEKIFQLKNFFNAEIMKNGGKWNEKKSFDLVMQTIE
jgi:hypothetical protein